MTLKLALSPRGFIVLGGVIVLKQFLHLQDSVNAFSFLSISRHQDFPIVVDDFWSPKTRLAPREGVIVLGGVIVYTDELSKSYCIDLSQPLVSTWESTSLTFATTLTASMPPNGDVSTHSAGFLSP